MFTLVSEDTSLDEVVFDIKKKEWIHCQNTDIMHIKNFNLWGWEHKKYFFHHNWSILNPEGKTVISILHKVDPLILLLKTELTGVLKGWKIEEENEKQKILKYIID